MKGPIYLELQKYLHISIITSKIIIGYNSNQLISKINSKHPLHAHLPFWQTNHISSIIKIFVYICQKLEKTLTNNTNPIIFTTHLFQFYEQTIQQKAKEKYLIVIVLCQQMLLTTRHPFQISTTEPTDLLDTAEGPHPSINNMSRKMKTAS